MITFTAPADMNTLITAGLAAAQLIVTSYLLIYTVRVQRKIQAADTSMWAQERYEQLLDTRDRVSTAEQADRYYDRFWGAQADQFAHWQNGLIPSETYLEWMSARRQQARKDSELAGISFKAAWLTRYDDRYGQSRFGEFMSAVLAGGNPSEPAHDREHIRKLLRKYRRSTL